MVGDAAGVERVVQAVRDRVVRPRPGNAERLAAHGPIRLVVAPGEPDGDRVTGRAGGDVHAHQPLLRRAQVRPERRIVALPGAHLLLGHQRQLRQVGDATEAARQRADPLPIPGRAVRQVRDLTPQQLIDVDHSA